MTVVVIDTDCDALQKRGAGARSIGVAAAVLDVLPDDRFERRQVLIRRRPGNRDCVFIPMKDGQAALGGCANLYVGRHADTFVLFSCVFVHDMYHVSGDSGNQNAGTDKVGMCESRGCRC